ncbi:helix-turn-helix transcriptional regulator [Microbacterium sediminicola]
MSRITYSAISSYSRVRLLHLLQERPARTVGELCDSTGLHPNTVREHLQRLVDGGYVVTETEHRTTRGRPRMLYSAATGAAGSTSSIARRKAEQAARRGDLMRRVMPWTDAEDLPSEVLHQLDALVDDLGDAGFEPVVDETTLTVDLSPCPHASSSATNRATLCAVHLGLMEGVLAQAGGPLRVACMADGAIPEQCVVNLALRAEA